MFVLCVCCVLLGRGICDGPITRPEESYRLCVCVYVCLSVTTKPRHRGGLDPLGLSSDGGKTVYFGKY